MRPKGAYTSTELIADGIALYVYGLMSPVPGSSSPLSRPVAPDMEFLPGQVDTARHSKPASPNREPYSNRTNEDGPTTFITPSLIRPRASDQQNISALDATDSKRSGSTLTGVTVGCMLAAGFAVLLLILVPCYLKRRRRHRADSTHTDDMEDGLSQRASFEPGSKKTLSISHSHCLPQNDSSPPPPVSRPLPKMTVLVGLPTSPSFKVKVASDRTRKSCLPARPQPLLISSGRANREPRQGNSSETVPLVSHPASPSSRVTGKRIKMLPRPPRPPTLLTLPGRANSEVLQGDLSETAVPVSPPTSPSSRVTGETIRKPSLPKRPPPLLLHPERVVRRVPKIDSNTATKLRTITPTNGGSRGSLGSLLPNPWDSDAKPQHATFESPIFQRPSFAASMPRANTLKTGLPARPPRETRIFMPPKVRWL